MNSVILIGNLTKDVDLRWSTGNDPKAIARFTIAVNDGFGEKQTTSFISIVVFGKQAENCEKYLSKGKKVCINGRIQTGSYEKDGRTVYTTDVIANNYGGVEFLSSTDKKAATNENSGFSEEAKGFTALTDDDIPFA